MDNAAYSRIILQARKLRQQQRLRQALSLLNSAEAATQNNVEFQVELSQTCLQAGKLKQALQHAKHALVLIGNDAQILSLLATIYLELKQHPQALANANDAINLDAFCWPAWRVKAYVLLKLGSLDAAQQAARQALSLNMSDHISWQVLVQSLRRQNKLADALQVCQSDLQHNPHNALNLCSAGILHLELGNKKQAVELLRASLQYNSNCSFTQQQLQRALRQNSLLYQLYSPVQRLIEQRPRLLYWAAAACFVLGYIIFHMTSRMLLDPAILSLLLYTLVYGGFALSLGIDFPVYQQQLERGLARGRKTAGYSKMFALIALSALFLACSYYQWPQILQHHTLQLALGALILCHAGNKPAKLRLPLALLIVLCALIPDAGLSSMCMLSGVLALNYHQSK